METQWASLMSYGMAVDLLKDVLPIHPALSAETVRKQVHRVAERQDKDIHEEPKFIGGCPNEWENLPKPDKPLVVGIDGGYVKSCEDKKNNFEVIVGKCFSKTQTAKNLGFVQTIDDHSQQRLMHLLNTQGMQANQQVTFLSDGGDTVRALQYIMHPEAEHVLDWFHVTMRLTVLNQFAKGLNKSDDAIGEIVLKGLESAKWYLWHGNVTEAIDKLEDCYINLEDDTLHYNNLARFQKHLEEMSTYIENNQHLIPNYGEKYRFGETITTSFVESAVNQVIAKRMVKKQQMQWSLQGAHDLLQTRTAVLNDELRDNFEKWYPAMKNNNGCPNIETKMGMAA